MGKISHKKYPCTDLVGLAPSGKAYNGNKSFCVGLRRVVTSGDPLDMAHKRGHRTLEKLDRVLLSHVQGKSLLLFLSPSLALLLVFAFIFLLLLLLLFNMLCTCERVKGNRYEV